ncbi:MAG: hypothetical protein ACYS32_06155 [Planctomycetota bacterium]
MFLECSFVFFYECDSGGGDGFTGADVLCEFDEDIRILDVR